MASGRLSGWLPNAHTTNDPAALVAEARRSSSDLIGGWRPAYADLDGIVRDALTWERRLLQDCE
jgi:UDP-glucose 4-epimerase